MTYFRNMKLLMSLKIEYPLAYLAFDALSVLIVSIFVDLLFLSLVEWRFLRSKIDGESTVPLCQSQKAFFSKSCDHREPNEHNNREPKIFKSERKTYFFRPQSTILQNFTQVHLNHVDQTWRFGKLFMFCIYESMSDFTVLQLRLEFWILIPDYQFWGTPTPYQVTKLPRKSRSLLGEMYEYVHANLVYNTLNVSKLVASVWEWHFQRNWFIANKHLEYFSGIKKKRPFAKLG